MVAQKGEGSEGGVRGRGQGGEGVRGEGSGREGSGRGVVGEEGSGGEREHTEAKELVSFFM